MSQRSAGSLAREARTQAAYEAKENALLRAALESARKVAELEERDRRQTAELKELAATLSGAGSDAGARVEAGVDGSGAGAAVGPERGAASEKSAGRVAGVVAAVDADRASLKARTAEGTVRLAALEAPLEAEVGCDGSYRLLHAHAGLGGAWWWSGGRRSAPGHERAG